MREYKKIPPRQWFEGDFQLFAFVHFYQKKKKNKQCIFIVHVYKSERIGLTSGEEECFDIEYLNDSTISLINYTSNYTDIKIPEKYKGVEITEIGDYGTPDEYKYLFFRLKKMILKLKTH